MLIAALGSTMFRQAWQNESSGFRMCIMEAISAESVVISKSRNGL